MSASPLSKSLSALLARLVQHIQEDPELKKHALTVLETMAGLEDDGLDAIRTSLQTQATSQEPSVAEVDQLDDVEQEMADYAENDHQVTSSLPYRKSPGRRISEQEPETTLPLDEELTLVEDRCRLKAEGARWAVERERLLADGRDYEADIQPKDRMLIGRARDVQDCFLWMNHPRGPHPDDPGLFDALAESFEVLGEAASLLAAVLPFSESEREVFEQTLELTAEGQSAVRAAVMQLQGDEWADPDQERMFRMLRELTRAHSVYVSRHMRLDDPADPFDWETRANRILDLEETLGDKPEHRKDRRQLLIRYRELSNQLRAEEPDEPTWNSFVDTLDGLIQEGLAYSSRALRIGIEPLAGRLDSLNGSAESQEHLNRILREIDLHNERRDHGRVEARETEPTSNAVLSVEVEEVADLLSGRAAVYIGGEVRENAKQALESAFGLNRLAWLDIEMDVDLESMDTEIAGPEVAVVLVATRWVDDMEKVETVCDRFEKPLVELPGGYHPNQVALQIIDQAIERL